MFQKPGVGRVTWSCIKAEIAGRSALSIAGMDRAAVCQVRSLDTKVTFLGKSEPKHWLLFFTAASVNSGYAQTEQPESILIWGHLILAPEAWDHNQSPGSLHILPIPLLSPKLLRQDA